MSADAPIIRLAGVTKTFGGHRAVDDLSLDIAKGELFCLLGGSGSGKSTLLRMLAGFETPDEGTIEIDGRDMVGVDPADRPVNMMFQSYALFPHMSVADNVAYGLKRAGIEVPERKARMAEMLRLVKMDEYGKRKPHQLSGGQRQRVALARALARSPKLLLLDEPLSALDKKLRQDTQFELMDIFDKTDTTFVVVTHDQEEAMVLATRVAVMDKGKLAQVDTPRRLYEFPQTRFVADFIGEINLMQAVVTGAGTTPGTLALACPTLGTIEAASETAIPSGTSVTMAVRPEKITFTPGESGEGYAAKIDDLAYMGGATHYRLRAPDGTILSCARPNLERLDARPLDWEQPVRFTFAPQAALILTE